MKISAKKTFICLVISIITILNFSVVWAQNDSTVLLPSMIPFYECIGEDNIDDIQYGVIVDNTEKRCADIDYEDLRAWLEVYWDFRYDLVIAPLGAYDLSGNYVKLWNSDKTKSYCVYPNGGILAGKYGEAYESHGEIKQNYIWYLPVIGNSRNALNTANGELTHTYLYRNYEGYKDKEREFTAADELNIPAENLLVTDGASDWAKSEIDKAAACNLMIYSLSDKYTAPITRLDFCRLAARLIATEFNPYSDSRTGVQFTLDNIAYERGITDASTNKFTDCSYVEIDFLASAGIINGMGDGTFAPDSYITREQAAAILERTAVFLGNKTMPETVEDPEYLDRAEISDWAVNSISTMYSMDIMQGDSSGHFRPKDSYTTEQAIATMLRLYECL